ncbi:MAG: GNAT family N-acetyltransferase [Coriobacteriia bacterium]|nr:GNAT family N-acetyltransferase [Coriobacteriia bacterium]
MRLTAEWHRGANGLEELWGEWHELADRIAMCRTHQRPEAFRAYLPLVADDNLWFIALRDETGLLRAVCPLRIGRDYALRVPFGVISTVWGWEYEWPIGEIIAPEDDTRTLILPTLTAELQEHSSPQTLLLAVGPLAEGSRLWEGLEAVPGAYSYAEPAWDWIECAGTFEDYFAGLSKNFRGNLRKARNKLKKLPDLRWVTATAPEDVLCELRAFMLLEASGWKSRTKEGEPVNRDPRLAKYYEDLFTGLASIGLAELNALYAGNRCIASQLCMRSGDGLFEMAKIAYDEEYARMAPGNMLFEHTVQRLFEDSSVQWLDLMSDAKWHDDWKPVEIPMRRAYIPVKPYALGGIALARLRFGPVRTLARAVRKRRAGAAGRRG